MTDKYDLENIRNLLTDGFSEEELRSFCFDHPDFRPVHNQLSASSGKSQIVQRLVEYAYRQELFGSLLAWAEEKNSAKYKKYDPYYVGQPSVLSNSHPEKLKTTKKMLNVDQRIAFSALVFTVLACIGTWLALSPASFIFAPEVRDLTIRVVDNNTGNPVEGADVLLLFNGESYTNPTDTNGIVKFKLASTEDKVDVVITVQNKGYEIKDQNLTLWLEQVQNIRLDTVTNQLLKESP